MFVLAAVVAPPDPLSMVMFAVPLLVLYEISIIAAALVEPKPVQED
jgi:sec-independent protein translocase protein TatC